MGCFVDQLGEFPKTVTLSNSERLSLKTSYQRVSRTTAYVPKVVDHIWSDDTGWNDEYVWED